MDPIHPPTDYCVEGCGKYGHLIFKNKCQRCLQNDRQAKLEAEKKDALIIEALSVTETTTAKIKKPKLDVTLQAKIVNSEKEFQTSKSRCYECQGKVSLIKQNTNQCRCDFVFCDSHKLPEQHDCTYDFANAEKEDLTRNNPRLHEKPRGGRNFNRTD